MSYSIPVDLDLHRLIEARRTAFDQTAYDIVRQSLDAPTTAPTGRPAEAPAATLLPHSEPRPRSTGRFTVRLGDQYVAAASQADAYKQAMLLLHHAYPGLLERLADVKSRRRRIVARSVADLYDTPRLRRYGELLADDWFIDMNLSRQQKLSRLKTACRLAGIWYGQDLDADLD